MLGVPMGTDEYHNDFANEVATGEAVELLRMLVNLEDAQASFLRLSASSRSPFLLHTLPPEITTRAAEDFDALLEWALVSMIKG